MWVQMGALGVGGPSLPPASSALSARSPQTAPQNRRESSKKARCKAAPTTSDISTIGRCQCTEKNQSGLRQGGSPEDAVHPHSLGPGALACAFALTPAGCGGESGSAPRRSLPQCLGVPARAARLQQRLGEAPGSSPSPPDQMPRQICPGLQTREPRPPLPGRHTRSPAWRRWRRWRGGSASREGQSAPVPASPAPPAHSDGDLVAHVLVPPPAPAAQRGPSRSSGSRQRANSARWSLAIWTAGQVVKRLPDAQPPPPAHPARAHLAALRRPEAMRPRGDALQPLDQLLCPGWEMGEEGVALADGGGDSEREALRASLWHLTWCGRLQFFPGSGWEPPHTLPPPTGKVGGLDSSRHCTLGEKRLMRPSRLQCPFKRDSAGP